MSQRSHSGGKGKNHPLATGAQHELRPRQNSHPPTRAAGSPKRLPTLEAILAYPGSKRAFDKLVKDGFDRTELLGMLQTIVMIPVKRGSLVRGRTDWQVKNFPNRIELVAEEVQQINEKSGLMYEIALGAHVERRHRMPARRKPSRTATRSHPDVVTSWISQGICQHMKDSFDRLPQLLRSYALYLRYAIMQNRVRWSELQQFAIWRLQQRSYALTGRYHDEETAQLLTAAFSAAGQQEIADRFNADQLRMLRRGMAQVHQPRPSVRSRGARP